MRGRSGGYGRTGATTTGWSAPSAGWRTSAGAAPPSSGSTRRAPWPPPAPTRNSACPARPPPPSPPSWTRPPCGPAPTPCTPPGPSPSPAARASLLPFITTLIGYPCVIKPRAGADGEGVRLVRGAAEGEAAARDYPAVTDLLVEEYLEGPELAVESLSRAGRHRVLGWSRRLPGPGPGLAAAGHDLPAALDPATAAAVRALVRGVLDLAGHRDGPSHTEVVLTAHGPRLVEAHARPGAEELTQLLRLAHGTDVLGLALAAGLGLPGPLRRPHAAHAALRYVDFRPGLRVDGLGPALAAARSLPGVMRVGLRIPAGATVRRAPTGALHHAHILAAAPTAAALARTLDLSAALLAPPGPPGPPGSPGPPGRLTPGPRPGQSDAGRA
ncbi:hypothetical protein A6A28_23270 [Streptomyces sp. CB03578]|uniref:ATP-grasp domain-containing protein n=1 Tax=Streptomyces sp. CB03578 TaxID=1718987 RepID=UPI00093C206B|nr:ATP-grasp domain-containing protein [Streptomyces sp. CB03578]OKI42468.1 hypothetical protein A6A28_23270 [Streptomyces sp. CB03578]